IVSPKEECDPAASNSGCTGGKICNNSCACVVDTHFCGDGLVTAGQEACDDNANPTGCGAGQGCAACTCEPACPQVGGKVPTKLKFTQQAGTTSCGTVGLVTHCELRSADPNDPTDGNTCASDADCGGVGGSCELVTPGAGPFGGEVRDGSNTK